MKYRTSSGSKKDNEANKLEFSVTDELALRSRNTQQYSHSSLSGGAKAQ